MCVAADGWRKLKTTEPQKLDRPMRASLFVCFFAELQARLRALESKDEDVAKLTDLGWLAKGPPFVWHFLKWDAASQSNIVDTSKPPLTQSEILEHLQILLKNVVSSNSLARFHPTRPMAEDMRGDSLVFLIQVGIQGDAAAGLRSSLKALCYNASLQLVATQLREDRQTRSTLANSVAASLPKSS
ncbi:Pol [Symbiodinium sp. CCMP2592]|nr:Pol [Symbiodinium sp. CCMP2592]